MVFDRSWWSCLGRLLATAFMAMVVVGGTIDGLICASEPGASTAAVAGNAHTDAIVVDDAAQHGADVHQSEFGKGVCPHGHCHHMAAYALPPAVADASPSLISSRLAPERSAVSKSDLQFQLMRPPRA